MTQQMQPARPDDLTESLVDRYGEATTKATAATILGRHPATIRQMLQDGRLTACCEGGMVYVRSIAAYIQAPRKAEHDARIRKRIRDGKGRYMV